LRLDADVNTKGRALRVLPGLPGAGSSPAIQREPNLNRESGIAYEKGEGAKLRY
jgi:hypothetical protein